MENTLLVGLSRQEALRRSLDVISNNVANMNTTGFKADGLVLEEFTMPSARESSGAGVGRRISYVTDRATWHDHRQGVIQQTGNPLDVAIEDRGFLTVQTPRGERYTRNGALQINAAGELVTSEGLRVQGEQGPITLQPQDRGIMIGRDGTITTSGGNRGRLRVVDFAQPGRLQKDGSTLFQAPAGVAPQPLPQARVQQGALEKSNVQPVVEMTRLIDVTRTYSAIAQLAQSQSDLRRSAIDKLADVPA
jgi:flagellar basal-body rod protein FlgF